MWRKKLVKPKSVWDQMQKVIVGNSYNYKNLVCRLKIDGKWENNSTTLGNMKEK